MTLHGGPGEAGHRRMTVIMDAECHGTLSALVSAARTSRTPDPIASLPSETVPSLRQKPGTIEVHLPNLDALLDRTRTPPFPHVGPVVEPSIAKFLIDCVREQLGQREIEVVVHLDQDPLAPNAEAEARAHMRRYFATEAELTSLELRVNRSEGFGSLRYAIPLVLAALLVAGLFYAQLGGTTGVSYLEALTYLVFITIVWVLMWDPLEMLLFDSYMIRRRLRALNKLAHGPMTFVYRSAPGTRTGPTGAGLT